MSEPRTGIGAGSNTVSKTEIIVPSPGTTGGQSTIRIAKGGAG